MPIPVIRRREKVEAENSFTEALPSPDPEWQMFLDSEFKSYEEFKHWRKTGEHPIERRVRVFDERYERPVCRDCGMAEPELVAPPASLFDIPVGQYAFTETRYECGGCGRKWRTKALQSAIDGDPIPETVRVRKIDHSLPEQLRKPPRMTKDYM